MSRQDRRRKKAEQDRRRAQRRRQEDLAELLAVAQRIGNPRPWNLDGMLAAFADAAALPPQPPTGSAAAAPALLRVAAFLRPRYPDCWLEHAYRVARAGAFLHENRQRLERDGLTWIEGQRQAIDLALVHALAICPIRGDAFDYDEVACLARQWTDAHPGGPDL